MLIFPETTARSLGDLLKKEKEKINMFVSENSRKDYLQQRQRADSLGRNITDRNTKESFAFSDNNTKKRNNSLINITEPRLSRHSIVLKEPLGQNKKTLAPVE